jgi:mono/diheme cytochrome c family protein
MKFLTILLGLLAASMAIADTDRPTKFLNQGSVANTRHNMTQRQPAGGGPAAVTMDQYRSDYGEVCVYCHTPHGASSTGAGAQLPLWNRTITTTTYQVYSALNSATMTQPVTQPGANSLACLSCHDGQTAVDSVINMPGSGRYLPSQATAVNLAFLNTWSNPSGLGPAVHANMVECMTCHSSTAGVVGAGATDFRAFVLGTDLRDDHPVGVRYPANGSNPDFKNTNATFANIRFFDSNANGRPDKTEIRLYDTGDGAEVECASCHDPHGVAPGGGGGQFNPSFLRVSNAGSALCLACHTK